MTLSTEAHSHRLSSDKVLPIARMDAERVYRDLSRYSIRISEQSDGWHVDYELIDEQARGGGPHYVIHPVTGEIMTKRYDQ